MKIHIKKILIGCFLFMKNTEGGHKTMSTIFTTLRERKGSKINAKGNGLFIGTLNDDHTTVGVPAPKPPKKD